LAEQAATLSDRYSIMLRAATSHPRSQLEEWLKTLDIEAGAVADIGGQKLPVKNRVKSLKVDRYEILDLPHHDLNKPWPLRELYEVVFCLEVFEYIFNPLQAMKNLYDILRSGGRLYASFHFLYPHHNPEGRDYLRYTRWGVERLVQEAGFSSWEIKPRTLRKPTGIHYVYLAERMKGTAHNRGQIHSEQGYLLMARK
jgi:SAM-dependent methyltransferase